MSGLYEFYPCFRYNQEWCVGTISVLDLKLIREQPEQVAARLATRNGDVDVQPLLAVDAQVRAVAKQRSQLQAESNDIGKQVGQLLRAGATEEVLAPLRQRGQELKQTLALLEQQERELTQKLQELLLQLPNLPAPDVPVGKDETANVVRAVWGEAYKPQHPVLPHWEVAAKFHWFETERATKIAQSRFVTLWGAGGSPGAGLDPMDVGLACAAGVCGGFAAFFGQQSSADRYGATAQICSGKFCLSG